MCYRCCNYEEEGVYRTLSRNVGKICTVFTDAGEFTGLVADVYGDYCKIITALPPTPFVRGEGLCDDHPCRCGRGIACRRNSCGTYCTIPLDKISCVAASEV